MDGSILFSPFNNTLNIAIMLTPLRYNLLFIAIFYFISFSISIPIQQQEFKSTTTLNLKNYYTLNKLEEYYSTVATQVLDSTINEIVESASDTFLTIHQLQIVGRDYCQTSVTDFIKVLEYELENQVKFNLLDSIKPLIEKHYNQRLNIIELNTIISEQLDIILNSNKVADTIMKQIYHQDTPFNVWKLMTNNKWAETKHHERNESIALKAWLNSWLMDIQFIFKEIFDSQISALY